MPLLEMTNISKSYQTTTQAVANFSLTLPKGQTFALIGPSASGKTTILRLIAGLEKPDQGQITLNNQKVSTPTYCLPPQKRQIAMLFQNYALFPHLTVKQNIAYGLTGPKKHQTSRITQMLELVNLTPKSHHYPHQLSGGEQQRTALARALAPNPQLLLLDEPFSHLDPHLHTTMRQELIKILHQTQTTTLLVTHDKQDALAMADQIILIHKGQTQQQAPPQQIYYYPNNLYVANFFGPTNLIPAHPLYHNTQLTAYQTPLGMFNLNSHLIDNHIFLRPENLIVNQEGQGMRGSIKQLVFAGTHYQALIECSGLSQELTGYLEAREEWWVGKEVVVGLKSLQSSL